MAPVLVRIVHHQIDEHRHEDGENGGGVPHLPRAAV